MPERSEQTPASAQLLPDILVGPLLRRISPMRWVMWLVASREVSMHLKLQPAQQSAQTYPLAEGQQCLRLGQHAYLYLIDLELASPLPTDTLIEYDLLVEGSGGEVSGIRQWAPWLCYDGADCPNMVIASHHRRLMHGSCRKPHHDGPDGLVRADSWLETRVTDVEERPAWLLMTGDQVYVDDVAGPLLRAIHGLIERLGLVDEVLEGATVDDSQALYQSSSTYYRREDLLPDVTSNAVLRERFFGGVKKPVFTSANAHNHLMTLAEMLAMYFLAWSPTPWRLLNMTPPDLEDAQAQLYQQEQGVIDAFEEGLPQCARVMAHIPSLMIFDDHDVTDDWNLTAEWEMAAYGHPFSKRIIGNALLAYLLCQGWGNAPEKLNPLIDTVQALLPQDQDQDKPEPLAQKAHDALIDKLLRFEGWEYQVPGSPPLIVLDTRTRRWRSESNPNSPSGLMDWEALMEMQQALIGAPGAVIVSPAPMFGVKLIEGIQKIFTWLGKPLVVDAENWMAHRGAANVLLQIWRHSKTPGNFVILSGDVHYSFAYDIVVSHRKNAPQLWQVTSSGIKNTFPDTLLDTFDRLNRWLYAPWSPLNWLTKRRKFSVHPRDPDQAKAGERMWNGSGIGLVTLDEKGRPADIRQLDARGIDVVFPPPEALKR